MPGTIVTVTVLVGKRVSRGESLATLEAMKMETTVRAEIDGTVSEVLMRPGMQVDAKDLLAVIG
jgi:pyruvate carboxylase